MTDEQIIKAVEVCRTPDTCRGCPYHELHTAGCICALMKDVFDLISRQKADIARLKKKNTILSKNADTAFQDGLNENRDLFKKEVEPEIRNEAIKEFVGKLTDKISVYSNHVDVDGIVILNRIFRMIEDIEKEMTEVQK